MGEQQDLKIGLLRILVDRFVISALRKLNQSADLSPQLKRLIHRHRFTDTFASIQLSTAASRLQRGLPRPIKALGQLKPTVPGVR